MTTSLLPPEHRIAVLETDVAGFKEDFADIKADIGQIKATLIGRPSWPVVFLLTFLSAVTVGLVTALEAAP